VPLLVMVVAAAALVGVVLGRPLYINAEFQSPPTDVAKDESFEAAGYTWTLTKSGEFPHSPDMEVVPEGLAVTAAIIEVRPGADAETSGTCSAELAIGTGPEAQRWTTLGNPSAFNYAVADESTMSCQLEGEPFDLEVVYLTPEGTISESVVEVEIGAFGGELVRFALTDSSPPELRDHRRR
jgi:hypothetical protein